MSRLRTLKLLLGGANLVLAAATALFAAIVLFARPTTDLELPVPLWEREGRVPPSEDRCLTAVRNPISPATLPSPPGLELVLLGTLPGFAERSAAFLKSGKDEFVAFVGEGVGPWRLEEVGRDRAVFAQGGDRRVIRLDETAPPREPTAKRPR